MNKMAKPNLTTHSSSLSRRKASEQKAKLNVASAETYTPDAASFYDGTSYTGGIMPDACINCGNCSSIQAWTHLRTNCPVSLFDAAFDDTAPNAGDTIFDPTACIRCGNCVDYWTNNVEGECPGNIQMKIAPASQPEPSSWFTLSKKSGSGNDTIAITAQPNTSTSPRSAVVTVRAGSISKTLTLTQEGAAAPKGKITFRCTTGGEIPQEYVGYNLYIGDSKVGSPEFYADYGKIESITAGNVVVNFNNMAQANLEMTLTTIHTDMVEIDDIYFGISPSDDPEAEWVPLLYVTETGSESYTSDNMAVIIQNAFNGISEVIDAESLIAPSEPTCSWKLSAMSLLSASITQKTLDSASASEVTFDVFADLYPDGQRLNNDISMNNIRVGRFTLGAGSGQSLSHPVVVETITYLQFKWAKEWSTVALCRFTIKCSSHAIAATLDKNLVINGMTFTKHENGGTYFENTEGIPLRKTTAVQTLNISSNYPALTFNILA